METLAQHKIFSCLKRQLVTGEAGRTVASKPHPAAHQRKAEQAG